MKDNPSINPFRNLPSIDSLIREHQDGVLFPELEETVFTCLAREAVEKIRKTLLQEPALDPSGGSPTKDGIKHLILREIENSKVQDLRKSLQHVINATGVVIHTNLGRAPLSTKAVEKIVRDASRYCNLEYDLESGQRGTRGLRTLEMLARKTGAESALVVNNCAAATILVLSALAADGETIVSRGELVEIGGDFRIPDVMAQSGTTLCEVGTTNRTKVSDYEGAITDRTKVILRVHTSNFKVVGFTASPHISELAELADSKGIVLYEDAGSGALNDLSLSSLNEEPQIVDSISNGVHVVTFSGDKLLGGLQSGIIVGKKNLIDKICKHPLYRALRVDKLVYAALEATLDAHMAGSASTDIPTLKMISLPKEEMRRRSENFIHELQWPDSIFEFSIIESTSAIGGGSAPGEQIEGVAIKIRSGKVSEKQIEKALRENEIPIIARISDKSVLIDLRTVFDDEMEMLSKGIKNSLFEKFS